VGIFLLALYERLTPLVSVGLPALCFGLADVALPMAFRLTHRVESHFFLLVLLAKRLPGQVFLTVTLTNAPPSLSQLGFGLAQPSDFGLPGKLFSAFGGLFWLARWAEAVTKACIASA
jgi:hypothetical protein